MNKKVRNILTGFNVVASVFLLILVINLKITNNEYKDQVDFLKDEIETISLNKEIGVANTKVDMLSDFVDMLIDFETDTLSNDHKEISTILIDRFERYAIDSIAPNFERIEASEDSIKTKRLEVHE